VTQAQGTVRKAVASDRGSAAAPRNGAAHSITEPEPVAVEAEAIVEDPREVESSS
jgi:hypothetical protein